MQGPRTKSCSLGEVGQKVRQKTNLLRCMVFPFGPSRSKNSAASVEASHIRFPSPDCRCKRQKSITSSVTRECSVFEVYRSPTPFERFGHDT